MSCSRERWNQGPIADAAIGLPSDDREHEPDHADRRRLGNAAACRKRYMYKPHEERERDGHADRERAPRAFLERVDDRQAEPGEGDDDDEEDGDGGRRARHRPDFLAGDLGQRAAAAAGRSPEDDEVVNRARQADAGDEPDEPGSVAELCRQHRTDERTRPRDGREVMPEEDEPVGRVIVVAVVPTGAPGSTRLSSSAMIRAAMNAL